MELHVHDIYTKIDLDPQLYTVKHEIFIILLNIISRNGHTLLQDIFAHSGDQTAGIFLIKLIILSLSIIL